MLDVSLWTFDWKILAQIQAFDPQIQEPSSQQVQMFIVWTPLQTIPYNFIDFATNNFIILSFIFTIYLILIQVWQLLNYYF